MERKKCREHFSTKTKRKNTWRTQAQMGIYIKIDLKNTGNASMDWIDLNYDAVREPINE